MINKQNIRSYFIILAFAFTAYGRVIYVDADANGLNNGSSWANACNNLQLAIYFAQYGYDDEIWVAQGVYKPAYGTNPDRGASFELGSGITIKGGYAGFGEPDPNARDIEWYETILSGDLAGDDIQVAEPCDLLTEPTRSENSYHVLTVGYGYYGDGPPVLEGFTITGGNANGAYFPNNAGGGIVMDGYEVGVIITDCIFINNSAAGGPWPATGGTGAGGAIALDNSRGIFTRCWFIRNAAERDGGAVCMDGCGTCASSYAEFKDCRFVNNYAGGNGGALYNSWPTLANLINCILAGNIAAGSGGGLYHRGDTAYLVNCTFSGNSANHGGAIYNWARHSRWWPALTNCILWADKPQEIDSREPNAVYATYSDIEGGWPGQGNIDTDPCFVSPDYRDYHLQPGSPCIDAGDPNYIAEPSAGTIPGGYYFDPHDPNYIATSSELDLDGNPRVTVARVDMGAYEFQLPPHLYVDDDAPNDPGPGDPCVSDPLEDGSEAHPFDTIQEAIDSAYQGHTVIVARGTYRENINFQGKNIVLTSTNPTDWDTVSSTNIEGSVCFRGTESSYCTLIGFDIDGYINGFDWMIDPNGVHHTQATISYCILTDSVTGCGRLIYACDGTISNCLIADISYLCLRPWPVSQIVGCHGLIKNCTITNCSDGIEILPGGTCTMKNCIIYHRSAVIVHRGATLNISHCNLQGGSEGIYGPGTVNWGPGNINTDPCFAELNNGDYHLKSQAGRWDPHSGSWVKDDVTSPCIDAGNPLDPIGQEPFPNGGIINMGAYGGTAEASKSYFDQPVCETIIAGDINGDCQVDFVDFTLLALHWLQEN